MANYRQEHLQAVANRAVLKSKDTTRHKCFVSYHVDDDDEVEEFLESFGHLFIPTVVGVTEDDDFVDSDDTDYILDRIREEHLSGTTITMVLVGKCTWARKFVDWEVYASLRSYKTYLPSGLLAITLPSMADSSSKQLPARVADNVDGSDGYARWWKYPTSETGFRNMIDEAFEKRTNHRDLIVNSRARKKNNSPCS